MRLAQWQESLIQQIEPSASQELVSECGDFSGLVESSQEARLEIYRNNHLQSLMATLSERYVLCRQILGQACFDQFAKTYALQHPLRELNLNNYGAQFGQHLERVLTSLSQENSAFIGFEYLGYFAQLEWCIYRAYYAADNTLARPIGDMATLTQTQQEQIQFKLSPDIELLSSPYAIGELWLQLKGGVKTEQRSLQQLQGEEDHFILVYRKQYHGHICLLNRACYQVLKAVKQGASLGQLMEAGLDTEKLGLAIESGWVVGFEVNKELPSFGTSDDIQNSGLGTVRHD